MAAELTPPGGPRSRGVPPADRLSAGVGPRSRLRRLVPHLDELLTFGQYAQSPDIETMTARLSRSMTRSSRPAARSVVAAYADYAVEAYNLRKVYRTRKGRQPAVDGLDLRVPLGGVHGFLGPNGSGKTTTIRMLLGLITADAGYIQVFDHEVPLHLPRVIDRIGAIVEQPKFFPPFSGRKNLALLATRDRRAAARGSARCWRRSGWPTGPGTSSGPTPWA